VISYSVLFGLLAQAATVAPSTPPPVIVTRPLSADEMACRDLQAIANATMPELPKMVDTITRLDGIVTFCAVRTVNFAKFVNIDVKAFREGWLERKQAQWNDAFCKDAAYVALVQDGWRINQTLTFLSGERYVMTVACRKGDGKHPQ
jgi:hypothetical protein